MIDMENAYDEMRRLAVLLLRRLGDDVTITERELAEVDVCGKAIELSKPNPASDDVRARIVDEPVAAEV
jgi:hypothetical protein